GRGNAGESRYGRSESHREIFENIAGSEMKIALSIIVLACGLTLSILHASGESPRIEAATRPLRDGVPEIAVTQLRALLRENLSDAERASANASLAEALIAAGRPN